MSKLLAGERSRGALGLVTATAGLAADQQLDEIGRTSVKRVLAILAEPSLLETLEQELALLIYI